MGRGRLKMMEGEKYRPKPEDVQNDLDEVTGLLKGNIEQIMERDNKLSDLESQATNLESTAQQFETMSKKVASKYWWQDQKYTLAIGGVIIILIWLIFLVVGYTPGNFPIIA